MMNELIDWFGKDFRVCGIDDNDMAEIAVTCNENAMFFWTLQYGPYIEVLKPTSLRARIKDAVTEIYEKYC